MPWLNLHTDFTSFYKAPNQSIMMETKVLQAAIRERGNNCITISATVRVLQWKSIGAGFVEVSLKPQD